MNTEDYLKKFGLKFEDLNSVERESLFAMVDATKRQALTPGLLLEKFEAIRDSLVNEVSNYENGSRQDLYVKARLRNVNLYINILTSPDKAQRALEQALGNVKRKA